MSIYHKIPEDIQQHLDQIERHVREARGEPVVSTPWEFKLPASHDLEDMRKSCGLSRKDVADMTEYSISTIESYETGSGTPGRAFIQTMLLLYKREWPR